MITKDEVFYLARLSRLSFTENEAEAMIDDRQEIVVKKAKVAALRSEKEIFVKSENAFCGGKSAAASLLRPIDEISDIIFKHVIGTRCAAAKAVNRLVSDAFVELPLSQHEATAGL